MARMYVAAITDITFLLMPAVWVFVLAIRFVVTARTKWNLMSVKRPAEFDVGRATFALFNDVEWVLLGLMIPTIAFSGSRLFAGAVLGALGALLLLQSVWLIPKISAQITSITSGAPSQPSDAYLLYIGIDVAKIVLFAAIFWRGSAKVLPLFGPSW